MSGMFRRSIWLLVERGLRCKSFGWSSLSWLHFWRGLVSVLRVGTSLVDIGDVEATGGRGNGMGQRSMHMHG